MPRRTDRTIRSITNRSGLRNRRRSGRGQYSAAGKQASRDTYGKWEQGRCVVPERIAGRMVIPDQYRGR